MLKLSANLSLLFRERPLLERFAAARAAGFGAAEIQIPYEAPAAAIARASSEANLPVVLINAPLGPDPSSPGMACRPEHFRGEREVLGRVGSRPLLETINPHDVPGYCVASFELATQ